MCQLPPSLLGNQGTHLVPDNQTHMSDHKKIILLNQSDHMIINVGDHDVVDHVMIISTGPPIAMSCRVLSYK